MKLSARLFKLATENAADYLVSLNLKVLTRDRKRGPTDDPRAFYEALREEAKRGPLFSEKTIEAVHHCPVDMQKNETQWVATRYEQSVQKHPTAKFPQTELLRGIVDWIRAENPALDGLSFFNAIGEAERWHKSFVKEVPLGKYTTKEVVMDFPNGWSMVKVPNEHDLDVEGEFMGHCVGGDDYAEKVKRGTCTIYSLRDPKNHPHVTIEVQEPRKRTPNSKALLHREVIQVQGKENKEPIEKYHGMLEAFFHREGLHLQEETKKFLKSPEILAATANSNDLEHVARVAENKHLTPEVAQRIYDRMDPQLTLPKKPTADQKRSARDAAVVLQSLAHNPKTPTSVIQSLYEHPGNEGDILSKGVLVAHPNAPLDLVLPMIRQAEKDFSASKTESYGRGTDILAPAASNPSLPEAELEKLYKLATDAFSPKHTGKPGNRERKGMAETIFENLAANPSVPPAMLAKVYKLSKLGTDITTEANLCSNPSTPSSTLESISSKKSLMSDFADSVVSDLLRNPNSTSTVLRNVCLHPKAEWDESPEDRMSALLASPAYTPALLPEILSGDRLFGNALAWVSPLPEGALDAILANKPEPATLLEALPSNSSLSSAELQRVYDLVKGKTAKQRGNWSFDNFANNPKTPPSVLEDILEDILGNKEAMGDVSVIDSLARNPSTPDAILLRLMLRDHDVPLRTIAARPKLSVPVMEALLPKLISMRKLANRASHVYSSYTKSIQRVTKMLEEAKAKAQ